MFKEENLYIIKDYKSELYDYINTPSIFNSIANDIFKVVDRDNSGEIDKDEFAICMKQVAEGFGLDKPNNQIIDETYRKFDKDNNGSIDFEEFKIFVKYILNKILDYMDN